MPEQPIQAAAPIGLTGAESTSDAQGVPPVMRDMRLDSSADGCLTSGAMPNRADPAIASALEHHLSPLVEAALADVMKSLRAGWLRGPAICWGDVHPIRELARSDLDKRVAFLLIQGFLKCLNFFSILELFARELDEHGLVSEERLLGLEQLVCDFKYGVGHKFEVAYAQCGFGDVPGGVDGGCDGSN